MEYYLKQYGLQQGALEIQYIEEFFLDFPRKKTAAEVIKRLADRDHQILMAEASLPDGDPLHLPALLVERLGVGSTSEARRLIQQGGVKLDGAAVTELDVPRERLEGATLQAGKRRFVRFHRA